ncbi:MAG TPA: hypothetical protein VF173_33425 [Thermoanaerobaculia bacterium]|nr:hypothetical protein [Thermoanaerobaculia bacterium]
MLPTHAKGSPTLLLVAFLLISLVPTGLKGQTSSHQPLDTTAKFIQPPCCDPPDPPQSPPSSPPDPTIGGPEEFNAAVYVNIHPDLMNVYGSNLSAATVHWKNWGLPAGWRGGQIFDPQYYLQHNPDLLAAFGPTGYVAAMQHFMNQGLPNEGRRGSLEFDVKYYLAHNPDLVAAFGSAGYLAAADHFINQGLPNEGRAGSADFDVKNYINTYSDVKAAYGSAAYAPAFLQWLRRGVALGRSAPAGPLPALLPLPECNSSIAKPAGYNRIFINNGPGGPGTPGDTYDGSTIIQNGLPVYQFDNLLRDISEGRSARYGPTNLIVCVGPGVFQTEGTFDYQINVPHLIARGFTVGQNWHFHGAGVDATTLRLASVYLPSVVDLHGQPVCYPSGGAGGGVCEAGTLKITVNGLTETVSYDAAGVTGFSTVQAIASAFAAAFTGDPHSQVIAVASQGPPSGAGGNDWLIQFFPKITGPPVNYPVSTSITTSSGPAQPSLALTPSLGLPGDPTGATNMAISTNSDEASGVEVSDLTIDANFPNLASVYHLNLLAVNLRSFAGGHYIHRLNVVNAVGQRSEAFPVTIGSVAYNLPGSSHANPTSPPSQDNTIEYVTMSNWGGGTCTAITLVFATGTARFNVVNGYQIGYGGWEMPNLPATATQPGKNAFFYDNFALNTDYGFNIDSEFNNGVTLYFNEILHPRRYGFVIGSSNTGATRFTGFTLLYNTVEINAAGVLGVLFQGNVTNSLVGRTDFLADAPAPSGVKGMTTSGTNPGNIYQFNQIFSGFSISVPSPGCAFGNWNEVGAQRTDFPNTSASACVPGL